MRDYCVQNLENTADAMSIARYQTVEAMLQSAPGTLIVETAEQVVAKHKGASSTSPRYLNESENSSNASGNGCEACAQSSWASRKAKSRGERT